jgi:hypothetical protein
MCLETFEMRQTEALPSRCSAEIRNGETGEHRNSTMPPFSMYYEAMALMPFNAKHLGERAPLMRVATATEKNRNVFCGRSSPQESY